MGRAVDLVRLFGGSKTQHTTKRMKKVIISMMVKASGLVGKI